MLLDAYQLSLISIKIYYWAYRIPYKVLIRFNFNSIQWILFTISILSEAQKFSTRIRYSYFFCRYIYERKCMTTTEREWCEKVVYWKMMCFDHSFHLSLLNDQIIFWFDGIRWAGKPSQWACIEYTFDTLRCSLAKWYVAVGQYFIICNFLYFRKIHLNIIGASTKNIVYTELLIIWIPIRIIVV